MVASPNSGKRSLLTRILSWPSAQLFLVCFLIGGVTLCLGSAALSVYNWEAPASYSCKTGANCESREVGYLWAPNWSLTYAILGPLALFLMLETLKGIRGALDYLSKTEMIRNDHMEPVSDCVSSRAWEKGTRARRWFLVVCAGLVPALLAYPEWYSHNLTRLMAGVCNDCEPSDYDWGLAAIIKGTGKVVSWRANSAFDFVAFTCEALLIGATVACFIYLLHLDQVLPGPEGLVDKCLVPNLRSSDPRRGFQKFEQPLQLMLNACLTFFLICYSIRINRLYMRSVGYTSVVDFVQRDVTGLVKTKGVELQGSGLGSKAFGLFSFLFAAQSDPRYQDFLAGIALMLIAIFSLVVIILTIRGAAQRAKENAEAYYEGENSQSLFGLSIEEERKRTRKMTTWPLEWRYFHLNALLAIMGMAIVSLWYYRIGFYIVLVVIVTLLARFKKAVGT
jgi:hypothetical protein